MSDDQTQTEDQSATPQVDELALLKQRARMMGIQHSNNISIEKLREKIQARMEGTKPDGDPVEAVPPAGPNPLAGEGEAPAKPMTLRQKLLLEEMKLVRVRITNLDPKKKDLPGEIFTIANRYLGTVRKYVPYGEVTDNGYHLPYCIYRELEARRFLNIRVVKTGNGRERVESSWAKEFALEVLPPLTREELNRLATAQAAAGALDD